MPLDESEILLRALHDLTSDFKVDRLSAMQYLD
jgi:hypothetical protein